MRVLDKANAQDLRFVGEWQRGAAVTPPAGGTTVDSEARTAIVQLIAALVSGGILSAS